MAKPVQFVTLTSALLLVLGSLPDAAGQNANQRNRGHSAKPTDEQIAAATSAITRSALQAHMRFLSDDLLEGRGPGTRGDHIAQRYIAAQFESIGLKPAAPNGGWIQSVPLVGITTQAPEKLVLKNGDRSVSLANVTDFIATSGQSNEKSGFSNAEVVFVGYGIQAPEYDWDDFEDVDVAGKVLLFMNDDPSDNPKMFAGRGRLYYGRWDYKYAMAAKLGAAGAIIIHTTPSAGYRYEVVQTSWSGEQMALRDSKEKRAILEGWFTEDAAHKLAELSGKDLDKLRAAAQRRDFRPVPLGTTMSISMNCRVRNRVTGNVLGLLRGRDPSLRREMIIFMAHHDHLGMAVARDERGDNIFNGAVDNASGVASLLAIANACSQLPESSRPKRSILFAAVGAEEQGLLGSKYFAEHPPAKPGYLAAVINIDGMNIMGPTKDVIAIGHGKSDLDNIVEQVATWQKRVVTPDQFPNLGYYYRSDQFSLAKIGVPGVYLNSGIHVIGKPAGWGQRQIEEWIDTKYHQTSDEFEEDWDLRGAIDDTRLMFYIGMRAAAQRELPAWKPGDEFESARKSALEQRRRR